MMFRSVLSFAVLFAISSLSGKAVAQEESDVSAAGSCRKWIAKGCKTTANGIKSGLELSLDAGAPGTKLVYDKAVQFVDSRCGTDDCLSDMELETLCKTVVAYKCTIIGGDITSFPNPKPCEAFEEVPDGDCACGHKTICANAATKIALRFADVIGIGIGIGADGKSTLSDWQDLYDESLGLIKNCWGCLAPFLKKSVCDGLDQVAQGLGVKLPVECNAI